MAPGFSPKPWQGTLRDLARRCGVVGVVPWGLATPKERKDIERHLKCFGFPNRLTHRQTQTRRSLPRGADGASDSGAWL